MHHLRWWRGGTCALVLLALACIFTPGTEASAASETGPLHTIQGPTNLLSASPASTFTPTQGSRLEQLKRKDGSCKQQLRFEARTLSPCEYHGAYYSAKRTKPKLIEGLSPPGRAQPKDRKILYWRTRPGDYRLMQLENEAGKWYESPLAWLWYEVNGRECRDTWNCNTGNGYYGGLQMDIAFQRAHNRLAYDLWGTANNWPIGAQMKAADHAYRTRGVVPWPSTYKAYNYVKWPVPIPTTKKVSIRRSGHHAPSGNAHR